jgi:8-oxo-dGTP diphosphatase
VQGQVKSRPFALHLNLTYCLNSGFIFLFMAFPREYPERPIVGVGGVVIENGKALLIRRGSEPLLGQWSIPGGTLELGETILEGIARELLEETGLTVRVLDLIEVFERINPYSPPESRDPDSRPRFHFVIVDYLCEKISGQTKAGGDATDFAYAAEEELPKYEMTETAMRILRKAFAMDRARRVA